MPARMRCRCIRKGGVLLTRVSDNQIMQLREQRATVEEQLAEVKKSVDTLKKDIDTLGKREKTTQVLLSRTLTPLKD